MQCQLGTWVERAAAAVQLQDLELGFQLQLYAPHEMAMLYWCAAQYCATHRVFLQPVTPLLAYAAAETR